MEVNTFSQGTDCDVAIVGAGRYGLSAAAHLKAECIGLCLFGEPMDFWAAKMPAGVLRRSPRVASTLSDPNRADTSEKREAAKAVKPEAPLPLETFAAYGRWFREHLGTRVQSSMITSVTREHGHFKIDLGKDQLRAKPVVVVAGVGAFARKPAVFQTLPVRSHRTATNAAKSPISVVKRVAVIGAN